MSLPRDRPRVTLSLLSALESCGTARHTSTLVWRMVFVFAIAMIYGTEDSRGRLYVAPKG